MSTQAKVSKRIDSSAEDARAKPLHQLSSSGLIAWGLALTVGGPISAVVFANTADFADSGPVPFFFLLGALGVLLLVMGAHRLALKLDDVHRRIVSWDASSNPTRSSTLNELARQDRT